MAGEQTRLAESRLGELPCDVDEWTDDDKRIAAKFIDDYLARRSLAEAGFDRRTADRMAYEIAALVRSGRVDARSSVSDAALEYMQVGWIDGPKSVAEWVECYEDRRRKQR